MVRIDSDYEQQAALLEQYAGLIQACNMGDYNLYIRLKQGWLIIRTQKGSVSDTDFLKLPSDDLSNIVNERYVYDNLSKLFGSFHGHWYSRMAIRLIIQNCLDAQRNRDLLSTVVPKDLLTELYANLHQTKQGSVFVKGEVNLNSTRGLVKGQKHPSNGHGLILISTRNKGLIFYPDGKVLAQEIMSLGGGSVRANQAKTRAFLGKLGIDQDSIKLSLPSIETIRPFLKPSTSCSEKVYFIDDSEWKITELGSINPEQD